MQCLSFVVSSDFHHVVIVWEKQWAAAHVCIFMPSHDVFLQWVGHIFANNIRTCERSQSPRYPIFWMSMFWRSWLSLSRWHVTQSCSSIHSILTSLQEAAPRPQQTSLQPHNLEKHAQSSVLAGLATRGLLTHNAHSGSNTDVSLPIPYPSHPTILSRIRLPY